MESKTNIVIGENGKKCKVCKTIKEFSEFHKHKNCKYGYMNTCKECRKLKYIEEGYNRELARKRYIEKRDEILEYNKGHAKSNEDKIKEYRKVYAKEYRENNREYLNEKSKMIHRQRVLAEGEFTEEEFENISLDYFGWKCAYTGEVILEDKSNCHREHVIPISKGGVNYIWNIIPSTPFANISKKDRELEVWYREQPYFSEERLQKIYDYIEVVKASMDGEK